MGDFKRLLVWQKAHALAVDVHRAASRIRRRQDASLASQLVRASQSIPANIVEGRGQKSARDFARFVRYSINSGWELEHHLITARDTRALPEKEVTPLINRLTEVRRMLYGLVSHLDAKSGDTPKTPV